MARELPGVDPDGREPGGLEIAGNIEAHSYTQDGVTVGAPYPGVTADGLTPGGLVVSGAIAVGDPNADLVPSFSQINGRLTLQDVLASFIDSDNILSVIQNVQPPEGSGGGTALNIARTGDTTLQDYASPMVFLLNGSNTAQTLLQLLNIGGTGLTLDVTGPAAFSGVIGEHGKPPATDPATIAGNVTTGDLAALQGVVRDILTALDAKGSIINSTT